MEISAKVDEKIPSLKIFLPKWSSETDPSTNSSRKSVMGAFLSLEAASLKSSVKNVGLAVISLCSTILFTLERKRNELNIAGNNAIIAISSDLPAIAIAPYIAPNNKVPESPGKILLGNLWNV